MIDDLALSGEFVVDLRMKLCYTKGKPCEYDIAVLTGLRLAKPLCQLQTGQFPIPGTVWDYWDAWGSLWMVIFDGSHFGYLFLY